MDVDRRDRGLHPIWWAVGLLVVLSLLIGMSGALFLGTFRTFVPVTLTSDRAGLVMEEGGKIKMRGVEVGRVGAVRRLNSQVSLKLEIDPEQAKFIPANVEAQIRATTAFGSKYVDLTYPADPSPNHIVAGAVLQSQNVTTEVNTVFQSLTNVLAQIDPPKLNSVLSAFAEGLRGLGPRIGEATTAANRVLPKLNSRMPTIQQNWRSLRGFGDTYAGAMQDILATLDSATTTSATIDTHAAQLDELLVSVIGFSRSGIELLGPSKDNLVAGINALQPTTALLHKYDPVLTCLLVGAKLLTDPESEGGYGAAEWNGGRNGKSEILDIALLLGDDPYRFPQNLPITGAKGGPGGKPSCGSLPDVSKNFPQRYLVTNTGWGTGVEMRPNPGIGFPGYANYLPVTRGIPEPPSLRNQGGPAPGPIPYPGAPPYGAQQYGPNGTPLYPGLPPAPPPGAPRAPGPVPGAEPFVPPFPMDVPPTPAPSP
ncbi:Uncharacterised protein [Mycolicibacterium vanbaalenii]|uniref:Virulence factor Mce family protein n=1 Tax=Mycolicibacterium vanbaalenii TaxID=110539 RepID=A0A5S9PNE5_MYCVN|nr:MCE family protein [Mycolicibacterium vanbaalenii]CAA0105707.1 Uncharacterised protein [Mycolicibacterium vanbaalenii]